VAQPTAPAKPSVEEQLKAKKAAVEQNFQNAKQAAAQPAPGGVPFALTFDSPSVDLGKISDDARVPYKFTFTNTSTNTVKIINVTPGCGCTASNFATMKKDFAPGEKGEIEITFDPTNRRGVEVKNVTIDTDYAPAPRQELVFRAEVLPRVFVEPQAVSMFEVRVGAPAQQTVFVTGREKGFDVVGFSIADPNFTVTRQEKTEIKEGEDTLTRIGFQVTAKPGLPIGSYRGMLNLTTTDAKKSLIPVSVQAVIVGSARLIPDRLSLRMAGQGTPWKREFRIENRDNSAFEITGVELLDVPAEQRVVVDIEPAPSATAQGFRVTVAGVDNKVPNQINGKVVLTTTLADQPRVEVPINGFMLPANFGQPQAAGAPAVGALGLPPGATAVPGGQVRPAPAPAAAPAPVQAPATPANAPKPAPAGGR
jgi:hypothetical protein